MYSTIRESVVVPITWGPAPETTSWSVIVRSAGKVKLPVPNVPATTDAAGNPVQFVSTPDVGVPSNGVTRVGEVLNTSRLEPVSSVTAVINWADVAAKVFEVRLNVLFVMVCVASRQRNASVPPGSTMEMARAAAGFAQVNV